MKFFLLVLSSQALLCARVFSRSTATNDEQQSESDKQEPSFFSTFEVISRLPPADSNNIIEDSPVIKPKATHKAMATVDKMDDDARRIMTGLQRLPVKACSPRKGHWSVFQRVCDFMNLMKTDKQRSP